MHLRAFQRPQFLRQRLAVGVEKRLERAFDRLRRRLKLVERLASVFRERVIGDGGPAVVATMASETAGPRERDGPRR